MAKSRPKRTRTAKDAGSFYFYIDVDCYADRNASDLEGFCRALEDIALRSIEFHMGRGDFAAWIASMGDRKLAAELDKIKARGLEGEELRWEIHAAVKAMLAKPKSVRAKRGTSKSSNVQ